MKKTLVFIALLAVAFTSCKKDDFDAAKQAEKDEELIKTYIRVNNIPAQKDSASGLYYYIQTPGTGVQPSATSNVKVNYKGEILTSSKVFDEAQGVDIPLFNTIQGWKIGIPKIRIGGRITLFVPSALGYKNRANGSIPANSVLIFYIDLLNVNTQ